MDFGFGPVEVIGYQFNITFYCANGNVPTIACNTTGTSPYTSTNEQLNALDPPRGRQCEVTDEVDGSFITGEFTLSTSYPHVKEGTPLWNYTTTPLSWRASAEDVKAALEAVRDPSDTQVFGAVDVSRHVYWPDGAYKWSGQYNWSVTFDTRPGDVPAMRSNSTLGSTKGSASVDVGTARDGNEVDGGYGLSFCPEGGACTTTNSSYFGAFLTEDELKFRFSQAFFTRGRAEINVTTGLGVREVGATYPDNDTTLDVLDWLRIEGDYYSVESLTSSPEGWGFEHLVTLDASAPVSEGVYEAEFGTTAVSVTRTGPTQAMGYSWEVTFSNKTVGGDQPDLASGSDDLTGAGVDIVISEQQQGNQLTGTFTLSFNGETSSEIPYDASAASVQSAINSLASVYPSRVEVTRSEETVDRSQQVGGYTWTVVFDSSTWRDPTDHSPSETYVDGSWVGEAAGWKDTWPDTGEGRFSKAWGKNVGFLPDMECSSDGLGTTRNDGSEDCKVRMGSDLRIKGRIAPGFACVVLLAAFVMCKGDGGALEFDTVHCTGLYITPLR